MNYEEPDIQPATEILLQEGKEIVVETAALRVQGLFNQMFALAENTLLVAGGDEPLYVPAGHECSLSGMNEIHFAHGYTNSALHEIAHWCLAGQQRRTLVDYGYWYAPDGRTAEQQALFEKVEVKPQAIEWILTEACCEKFNVSFDNLSGASGHNAVRFKKAVAEQAIKYLQGGLPPRAEQLMLRFLQEFLNGRSLEADRFSIEKI
ncbi:elongation factor P hydroxylase [Hahella ganghwensis]|uniref:elongation factor P hydroxylase n=1 Tax=Hahella ganghwensis TaxID=286420 RepID=UPI00036900B3|nr:elongation factor P hydroxylase [Hahella ganghwensis]